MKRFTALLLAAAMALSTLGTTTVRAEETTAAAEEEVVKQSAVEMEVRDLYADLESMYAKPKNGEKYRIGFTIMSVGIDYFVVMTQALEKACEANNIELIFYDANGDATVQYNHVMDFIAQDVDAILISVLDSDGIVPAVEKANEAGIPVFCIDTYANGGDVIEAVCTDNYGMGVEAAHQIAARLTERYGEPKGKVFDLIMSLKFSSGVQREQGFRDTLEAEYPDIEVVLTMDASVQTTTGIDAGMSCTMDALQQLPAGELDAMWCHNDNNVIGAIRAMEQADRKKAYDDPEHIIIFGVDGQKNVYDMITEGYVDGMIMQQPGNMSRYICGKIMDYWTTGERKDPADFVTSYPYQAITATNYDSFDFLWFHEIQK